MARKKNYSLKGLIRRFFFSLCLIIAGSWLMLTPRLEGGLLIHFPNLDLGLVIFYIGSMEITQATLFDFAGLSFVFLGFFMTLYYQGKLSPRLRRLAELNEDLW